MLVWIEIETLLVRTLVVLHMPQISTLMEATHIGVRHNTVLGTTGRPARPVQARANCPTALLRYSWA